MVKMIKHVVLNRPKRMVATNDDPTRGTEENPYSIDEAYALYYAGLWVGGWVECYGYIPADLEDWGYYGSGSGTSGSYDPYEEEINPNEGGDGMGGNGSGNGENGNQGEDNQNGNQGNGNDGGGNGHDDEGSNNTTEGSSTTPNLYGSEYDCFYNCLVYLHQYFKQDVDVDLNIDFFRDDYTYGGHNNGWYGIANTNDYENTYHNGPEHCHIGEDGQVTIIAEPLLYIEHIFETNLFATYGNIRNMFDADGVPKENGVIIGTFRDITMAHTAIVLYFNKGLDGHSDSYTYIDPISQDTRKYVDASKMLTAIRVIGFR